MEEQAKLRELLAKYHVAVGEDDLGYAEKVKHKISLTMPL